MQDLAVPFSFESGKGEHFNYMVNVERVSRIIEKNTKKRKILKKRDVLSV